MSLCPHCQKETHQADFCQGCFRSLQASPPGRFSALLEQSFSSAAPSESLSPAADLLSVTFQPRRRKFRAGMAGFKVASVLVGLTLLTLGSAGLFQRYRYSEAVRHRQSGVALMRLGDYEGARRQLDLAPEEAETHRARAELAVAQGKWEEAAAEFRIISVDDAEVNSHVDAAALQKAQDLIKQARQLGDSARALSCSDQAEQLLNQHHGSPAQLAQVHFLRAQLFQKLDLPAEALGEVRQTLERDPGHVEARRLLSLLQPAPAPPVAHLSPPPRRRPAEPDVGVPRLQMDPGYPTYQPPEPEFPQYSSSDPESEQDGRRKRRRKSGWTDR
ncbi:MAG: hypothetical protein U0931_19160 [Vulcanimicrobiota bacterium]